MSTVAPGLVVYQIDPAHSHAQFKVRHMMIANVRGEFSRISGTVTYDSANPSASTVQAVVETASISTRDEQRDTHLKSGDFFDVQRYPTITFQSQDVLPSGGETFEVVGDLTIRGVTRPVALAVQDFTAENKDPWGNMRRGASAKTKISRKDFGLFWNVALESGGFLVGDEIEITLDVELIRQS